jgi:hypothetical protein
LTDTGLPPAGAVVVCAGAGAVVFGATVAAGVPLWLRLQAERPSALRSGLAALRPIAVSIRLMVANP